MRYVALAADYDGTLAHHGLVDRETVDALQRLRASGRTLLLVTGRELDELLGVFPEIGVFDLVVAENGGLLYWPETRRVELLCDPPPERFVTMLRGRQVDPLAVGRSIVATVHPNETAVLECIRDLGVELHVIFNKGAVMVLPTGVNKASGLAAALDRLALSPRNVVAVGDAENDHSMLEYVEYGVAVANAVPTLKEAADRVTERGHGAGVIELIGEMVAHDLARRPSKHARRTVALGERADGTPVTMPAGGESLLVAGTSGSGKSLLAGGVLERLAARGYQVCIIDPEGDYQEFPEAIVFGAPDRAPSVSEVLTALEKPAANVVVSLIGLPLDDRPGFFLGLWPRLAELRGKTGRPHWILVDETHHLLPAAWQPASELLGDGLAGMLYVTVHPEAVAPAVLRGVTVVAALGQQSASTLAGFARAAGIAAPPRGDTEPGPGEALIWMPGKGEAPFPIRVAPSETERLRHRRKYAEGELPPDRSFYFRGPSRRLNLRAQNLILFMQLGDGVDDETWLFHLRRGDFSEWILNAIKDAALAGEVRLIEKDRDIDVGESRARVRAAIEARYTLPATEAHATAGAAGDFR
jgi:hypothetical protein